MRMIKSALACLAISAAAVMGAQAQISVQIAPNPEGCKDLIITNTTAHTWVVTVPYHYASQDGSGQTHDWQSSLTLGPFQKYVDNTGAFGRAGLVNCKNQYHFSHQPATGYDLTARQEAEAKRIEDSRKEALRQILEREQANKRRAEELERQRQAEIAERQRKAAEQQAQRDAAKQRSLDVQRQQQAYQDSQRQQVMAKADPRCRMIDWESYSKYYNSCLEKVRLEDAKTRQAALDAQRQTEAADRARQLNSQVMSMTSGISPANGCQTPQYQTAGIPQAEANQVQVAIHNAWVQCMQVKNGQDAAVRAQQQQAAYQQQQAILQQQAQQQAMIAAQQQAQLQADLQQLFSNMASSLSQANGSLMQTSRSVQSDNDALERYLRGN